jgi:hypothetical protein
VRFRLKKRLPVSIGFYGFRTQDQSLAYRAYCRLAEQCAGRMPSETEERQLQALWWRMSSQDRSQVPLAQRPLDTAEAEPWE